MVVQALKVVRTLECLSRVHQQPCSVAKVRLQRPRSSPLPKQGQKLEELRLMTDQEASNLRQEHYVFWEQGWARELAVIVASKVVAGRTITATLTEGANGASHSGVRNSQETESQCLRGEWLTAVLLPVDNLSKSAELLFHSVKVQLAREKVGDDSAEEEVGVSDRQRTASAVTSRSWVGTGTTRANFEEAALPGKDRATTSGHGVDIQLRSLNSDLGQSVLENML